MRLLSLTIAFLFISSSLVRAVDPADLNLSLGGIYKDIVVEDKNDLPTDSIAGQPNLEQVSGRLGHARYGSSSSSRPPRAYISGGGVVTNNQPKTFVELFSSLEKFPANQIIMEDYRAIRLRDLSRENYFGKFLLFPKDRYQSIDDYLVTEFQKKYGILLSHPAQDSTSLPFLEKISAYPLGHDPINGNTITDHIYFTVIPSPRSKETARVFFWIFGNMAYNRSKFDILYLGDFFAPVAELSNFDLQGFDIALYDTPMHKGNAPIRLVYRKPRESV